MHESGYLGRPEKLVLHVGSTLPQPSETFIRERLRAVTFRAAFLALDRTDSSPELSCPHRTLTVQGNSRPRRLIRQAEIAYEIRRSGASVVHAHYGTTGLAIRRPCVALGVPFVVSFYGFDVGLAGEPAIARSYRRMFESASAITAEGPYLAQTLVSIGASARTTKLLPLSAPSWSIEARARTLDWNDPRFTLLQVARFVEKKGVDLTLRALAAARKQGLDVHLLLAGSGPLLDAIKSLIGELGLRNQVSMLGFVRHDELPSLFGKAHVLIHPSRTAANGDTEGGHPTVLIEAQACGLPVLATTHADIPFVVDNGISGALVPENDVDALTGQIVSLAKNRTKLAEFGSTARRRTLRRHDPEVLLRLRERLYQHTLNRS